VIRLAAEGLTNPQIAGRLFLSRRTVDAHFRRIYDKIGASSRETAIELVLPPDATRRLRRPSGPVDPRGARPPSKPAPDHS
jgi:hypothetical protein